MLFLFTLLGLQMVSTGRHQSCDDAQEALDNNSECQEALDTFDVNNTTSDSPLCTRPCHHLVNTLLVKCDEEFVSS